MQVKISDPSLRQDRHGPIYEEREIHVSNIHFDAREGDLEELFSGFGRVETVRIPSKVNGEHRGFGFVVFSKKVRSIFVSSLFSVVSDGPFWFTNTLSRRRQSQLWLCTKKNFEGGRYK